MKIRSGFVSNSSSSSFVMIGVDLVKNNIIKEELAQRLLIKRGRKEEIGKDVDIWDVFDEIKNDQHIVVITPDDATYIIGVYIAEGACESELVNFSSSIPDILNISNTVISFLRELGYVNFETELIGGTSYC